MPQASKSTNLPELLFALRRRINDEAKVNTLKYELTVPQFEVLWLIQSSGEKSMEALAAYLGVKPPSVTAMIDKMERGGLVKRQKDACDRRIVHIGLTTKTKRQLTQLRRHKEAVFNRIVGALSRKDRAELTRILSRLVDKTI